MGDIAKGATTPLTFMQSRFVDELVANPDVTQKDAYIRAGYSENGADQNASILYNDPRIKAEVEKRRGQQLEAAGVTKERVLTELVAIAFTNLQDIVKQDEDGNTIVTLGEIPADKAGALTGLKIEMSKGKTTVRKVDIKLADKIAALTLLGKHLGMFKEDVNVKASLSWADLVEQAMEVRKIEQPVYAALPAPEAETAS